MAAKEVKKVVLAYSGGLDTSIIIPWLKEHYNNEPDDSMIECAIRSLELVLPSEKGKDAW